MTDAIVRLRKGDRIKVTYEATFIEMSDGDAWFKIDGAKCNSYLQSDELLAAQIEKLEAPPSTPQPPNDGREA